VDIDTSWLLTRQVDEIINFIPTQTPAKYVMAIASPEAGVKLLEELQGRGYGDVTINRGLNTQTTVSAALKNRALIQHNLNLQNQKLNPIKKDCANCCFLLASALVFWMTGIIKN
jgi:protein-arginine deiminase